MQTAIIIPVYNHGRTIGTVVARAKTLGLPIIVVNDGSTDSTAAAIASLNDITVITHRHNQGKGAALMSGFQMATDRGYDWALSLDADGQHHPEDGAGLLAAVREKTRCLVIGRRSGMEHGLNVPWTSRFGRGFSNFWVWACGGPWLMDSQSGFRLYPLPETAELGVVARRYEFEVEVLVRAHRHGLPLCEVPVRVVYQPGTERVSHFRPWLDFMRNSRTFSRLLAERLACVARFRR